MLTEKSQETPAPSVHHAPAPAALDDLICYFEGEWVPMRDAKVSIMTHAFMYGTATFEGIRAYWNEDQGQLYGLKIREHVERIRQSCRILLMKDVPSVDELTAPRRRDRPPERVPRRTPTSGRRSTSRPGRSGSGFTISRTSCTSWRCRSGTTSTPKTAATS